MRATGRDSELMEKMVGSVLCENHRPCGYAAVLGVQLNSTALGVNATVSQIFTRSSGGSLEKRENEFGDFVGLDEVKW